MLVETDIGLRTEIEGRSLQITDIGSGLHPAIVKLKTAAKTDVKNRDLWTRLDGLLAQHRVNFEWVRGHAGHPMNERCDVLARTAAQGRGLAKDEGYRP